MNHEARQFSEARPPDIASISPPVAEHKTRLRQRFSDHGASVLLDCELLELVLIRTGETHNAQQLAGRLLAKFGNFNDVIAAPIEQLVEVNGANTPAIRDLKIVEAAAHRMARTQIMNRPVLSAWDDLVVYCKTAMAHHPLEQFRVFFLNRKNVLIADELQQSGCIGNVPVYPREVMKRALALNASAIILVHNHPSGDAMPSEADIETTSRLQLAAHALEIVVHDHLIIGKAQEFSFRSAGLL